MGPKAIVLHMLANLGLKLWPHVHPRVRESRWAATLLFFLIILACVTFLFTLGACSTVDQKLNPEVIYQRDIELDINGEKFVGVAVPKRAAEYRIRIRARGKIDMLTIQSCHRMESFEEPSKGWFSDGRSFEYVYRPIPSLEDGRGCLLDIGAYERERGRHSWATIDFESSTETLSASSNCNGRASVGRGVSICQGKSGTIQTLVFPRRVKVAPDQEHCKVMQTKDEISYTYVMPRGECTFYFGAKDGAFHRHTTIGFESILIRGEAK